MHFPPLPNMFTSCDIIKNLTQRYLLWCCNVASRGINFILIKFSWRKFRKLLLILTSKHVSPLTCGKVFSACIRSALLHGSETWAPTAPDLQRLCRNHRAMIWWICSVKPHDEVPMEILYTKLGTQEVDVALITKRLRWYGHVVHASSWTNSITSIAIPCPRGLRRPRKSLSECVKADVNVCILEGINTQNREAWRSGVRRTSQLQLTPGTGKLSAV